MKTKRIATTCVLAALAVSPAQKVAAGGGDAIVGGVIGGIIGGAIVNEANKRHQRTYVRSSVSSAQRQENRDTQVALNYFGFPAGTPDGVLGRQSRTAMSSYQAFMGYAPTGQLTDYERMFLMTSYQRAMAGGPVTMQQAASNPMGTRGLLLQYRDEMAGGAAGGAMNGGVMAAAPQAPEPDPFTGGAQMAAAPAPEPEPAPQAQVAAAPAAPSGGLPSFMSGQGQAKLSLASHCNKVSVQTNSNGGFVTPATMSDPNLALNEQFCLARTYAISQGEDMAAKVQGFTPQQIASQCESFGPAMKEELAAVSVQPEDEVLRQTSAFIVKTGMAPTQLAATAKICLSVGYRTDNMDVALGSALLLTALGDKVYAELVGHHLAEGFGASKRPDLALTWYQTALDALKSGQEASFVAGQPDRAALIRKAAYAVAGKQSDAGAPSALPNFGAPASSVPVSASGN